MAILDTVRDQIQSPVQFLRPILGVVTFIYAVALVLWLTRSGNQLGASARWHLVFWTLGPPLWFAVEYFALGQSSAGPNQRLLAGQDVASKLWAAVLVVLLYFYPGGPFFRSP